MHPYVGEFLRQGVTLDAAPNIWWSGMKSELYYGKEKPSTCVKKLSSLIRVLLSLDFGGNTVDVVACLRS